MIKAASKALKKRARQVLVKAKAFGTNKVTEIAKDPGKHRLSSAAIWYAAKRYAAARGVEDMFRKRADEIYAAETLNEGLRFLRAYVRLYNGSAPTDTFYDFPSLLTTPEQKKRTQVLLQLMLNRHPGDAKGFDSGEVKDILQVNLFRARGLTPDDPEVAEYFRNSLERSISLRLESISKPNASFDEPLAKSTLASLSKSYSDAGKQYFLFSHTLLGAVRDGAFLVDRADIDLAVFADQVSSAELVRLFPIWQGWQTKNETPWHCSFVHHRGLVVDFHRIERRPDQFILRDPGGLRSYYFQPFELTDFPFADASCLVPDAYERVLDENYGNWRKRTLFFDHTVDSPAMRYDRTSAALFHLTDLWCKSVTNGWRHHARSATEDIRSTFGIDYSARIPQPVGELAVPEDHLHRTKVKPIVVVSAYSDVSPALVRALHSAASLSSRVVAGILAHPDPAEMQRRRLVAGSLRFAAAQIVVEQPFEMNSIEAALQAEPEAIVLTELTAWPLPQIDDEQCEWIVFDDAAVSLTRSGDGRVMARRMAGRAAEPHLTFAQ